MDSAPVHARRDAHVVEDYEVVKELGSGNFGTTRLLKKNNTGALIGAKYIERGDKIDHNVEREILIHRTMRHPNIIRFKGVMLSSAHLVILMEYANGGELFQYIQSRGRIPEIEARYFFQQLICGVAYCHAKGVCHRDLKLENVLLSEENGAPRLKICDFGYSKSNLMHSMPKSTVGTPAYIAPEVLTPDRKYNGQIADVWSCGVLLYVMLVGSYPFEDPNDPRNLRKSMQRTMTCNYQIPSYVNISAECKHLLAKIFVPCQSRIAISQIMKHPWFLNNLPEELAKDTAGGEAGAVDGPMLDKELGQDVEETKRIIQEANKMPKFISPDFDDYNDDDLDQMNEQYGTGSGEQMYD